MQVGGVGGAVEISDVGAQVRDHRVEDRSECFDPVIRECDFQHFTPGADVRARAIDQLDAAGVAFVPPASLTPAIENAVASGARPSLVFACFVVTGDAELSLLIPNVNPVVSEQAAFTQSLVRDEPLDVEPSLID